MSGPFRIFNVAEREGRYFIDHGPDSPSEGSALDFAFIDVRCAAAACEAINALAIADAMHRAILGKNGDD